MKLSRSGWAAVSRSCSSRAVGRRPPAQTGGSGRLAHGSSTARRRPGRPPRSRRRRRPTPRRASRPSTRATTPTRASRSRRPTKKNPGDYEALFNLGPGLREARRHAGGRGGVQGGARREAGSRAPRPRLSALYIDAGRIDDALAVAAAGLAKHPGSAPLHENLGIALAAHGDQDGASQEFDAGRCKLKPNDADGCT